MRAGWFLGLDPSRGESALAHLAGAFGVAAALAIAHDAGWPWWKYAVIAVVAYDLAGGVVANGLESAKRFYHGPLPLPPTRPNRFLHNGIGFAAVHVQPVVVGLLFGAAWWWGPLWYAWALAGVVLVSRAPRHLTRPIALLIVLAGAMLAPSIPAPDGLAWLPVVLLLKLVVAHAVPERPLSGPPGEDPPGDGTVRPTAHRTS